MKRIEVGTSEMGYAISVPDKKNAFEHLNRGTAIKRIRSLAKKYPNAEIVIASAEENKSEIEELLSAAGVTV